MFKSAKEVKSETTGLSNAGFVLGLETMEEKGGGVLLAGTAKTESAVSTVGQKIEVFMTKDDFKHAIGHNLARSLVGGLKRPPEWHAGTEVVLSGVWTNKEGVLQAKRGAVGSYCVAGQMDSERTVMHTVMGRPVLELESGKEKAIITMTALAADAQSIRVRMSKDGRAQRYDVALSDAVDTLRSKIAEQANINEKILAGKGFIKPVVRVSVPLFNPKGAFALDNVEKLGDRKDNLFLIAENGKETFVFLGGQDRDKAVEQVTKFLAENGACQAVPTLRIEFNKMKAVEIATAYANYLQNPDPTVDFRERWGSWEKVLSAFNNLSGKYTPTNLILETFPDAETGETRFSLERAVPVSNRSHDAMPGIDFNGAPPPAVAAAADDTYDVGALDVDNLPEEGAGVASDQGLPPDLAEALGAPPAPENKATARPRGQGLGL